MQVLGQAIEIQGNCDEHHSHHSAVSPVKGVWTRHGTRHSERSREGVFHRKKRWSWLVSVSLEDGMHTEKNATKNSCI